MCGDYTKRLLKSVTFLYRDELNLINEFFFNNLYSAPKLFDSTERIHYDPLS